MNKLVIVVLVACLIAGATAQLWHWNGDRLRRYNGDWRVGDWNADWNGNGPFFGRVFGKRNPGHWNEDWNGDATYPRGLGQGHWTWS